MGSPRQIAARALWGRWPVLRERLRSRRSEHVSQPCSNRNRALSSVEQVRFAITCLKRSQARPWPGT